MSTDAERERRTTMHRVTSHFRLSEDSEAFSFQASLYSTAAGVTESETDTLESETNTLEEKTKTLKGKTDMLKYASNIPAGPPEARDLGIYSSLGFCNTRGLCTLATFFKYAPRHYFVLYVHGWDHSSEKERTDYLAVRIGRNKESEEEVVRSAFKEWVAGLETIGEKCVEEAWADLEWMSKLPSWKEIKNFMMLSKLQRLRDKGWAPLGMETDV